MIFLVLIFTKIIISFILEEIRYNVVPLLMLYILNVQIGQRIMFKYVKLNSFDFSSGNFLSNSEIISSMRKKELNSKSAVLIELSLIEIKILLDGRHLIFEL